MAEGLYGPAGFYRREEPGRHFRTSVHASPLFAAAVARLVGRVDRALGHPDPFDLVDVGAGRGELLTGMLAVVTGPLRTRLRPVAVEVAGRPADLPAEIGWEAAIPPVTGLLVANEWLDNQPVGVVEQTGSGPRQVLVDPAGQEQHGPPVCAPDAGWLADWWPVSEVGARAEVGRLRDAAWAGAVSRLRRGAAVAIDYQHSLAERTAGVLAAGTLTGYRAGRLVPPVPDGSCDLTAHVALDACAEAGRRAGAAGTVLTTQRSALLALGLAARRPERALASADPRGYLARLAEAGQAAELTDATGLGGFGWLLQWVAEPGSQRAALAEALSCLDA
jgi:SAM-dependent MidA family methyltransferase